VKSLGAYLQRTVSTQSLFNRTMALWASSRLTSILSGDQRQAIVDALWSAQHTDGGWSRSSFGAWKRSDGTTIDSKSDGYATGLASLALQEAGVVPRDARLARALTWLAEHQDRTSGMWVATSLNKPRDLATDIGKFMSDAATGYAVLSLTRSELSARTPSSGAAPKLP
jgi:hypothetical protein